MNKLSEKSITVGFNPIHGQLFFDTIQMYDKFIDGYFFSPDHHIDGRSFIDSEIYNTLRSCNTHGYRGNILCNNFGEDIDIIDKIKKFKEIINLTSVTILNPDTCNIVKNKFPDIEVHLSVRFWDWGRFKDTISLLPMIKLSGIDVINVSGAYHYNDFKFMNRVHELGMKVKFILEESCIVRKDMNYSNLPGFETAICRANPFSTISCQFGMCEHVIHKYPWMEFARVPIYKESPQCKYIDVFKLSSRFRSIEYVTLQLNYWTSSDRTRFLYLYHDRLDINPDHKYQTFLEWIDNRSKCAGNCWNCRKCEKYYKIISNK